MSIAADIIEHIIINLEGGYKLTNSAGDKGRQTYAGISRRYHPQLALWAYIDRGEEPPKAAVHEFYRSGFWLPIRGDEIHSPAIARQIMSFAVTSGPDDAIKAAQVAAMVKADGDFGPITLRAINLIQPSLFHARYALVQLKHYAEIVRRDHSQAKWIGGWANRATEGVL